MSSKLLVCNSIDRNNKEYPHLCFADDLLVFIDGTKRSVEGVLKVFTEFAAISGLQISVEKSTLYVAGISEAVEADILSSFSFSSGELPVRYLGLPLLTKRMTVNDYLPLVGKVRKRMSNWTGRFLSHAGRLQLISSVITSLANFWMAAFRLPGSCFKEIERLCSAFLWSGPALETTKAKVSWKDLCLPKSEGGLGLRPLKEVNTVHCLKLIWRICSSGPSLWVQWLHCYLIRKGSFWSIKDGTTAGSWVWRKLLKLRDIAKPFIKKEIRSGQQTSFWYDQWSKLGNLKEIIGDRGIIDLGISENATVAEALGRRRRRRHHRLSILNEVEDELAEIRAVANQEADITLWRHADDRFVNTFSSKKTWEHIRGQHQVCNWSKGVWFSHSTPKYSFFLWIALHGRLQTLDRMQQWIPGINTTCVLCNDTQESCSHLFFGCRYSEQIWKKLVGDIMQDRYTADWNELVEIISSTWLTPTTTFLIRYTLQATLHAIWRERNARRHGEQPHYAACLIQSIDKTVRLKLLSVKGKGHKYLEDSLMAWFGTR